VRVEDVINCGGIAEKNPLFMQIYADVLNRPMMVSASAQTCALGAAIMGATAAGTDAGGFASVEDAQAALCSFKEQVYQPNPANRAVYDELYELYCELHDSFGLKGAQFDHGSVMKRLLAIRQKASENGE
jgi:L-ribulokinase